MSANTLTVKVTNENGVVRFTTSYGEIAKRKAFIMETMEDGVLRNRALRTLSDMETIVRYTPRPKQNNGATPQHRADMVSAVERDYEGVFATGETIAY
jgi:hypothetical protein